ncbi:hypothetical protein FGO68_gene17154 [Halteria grandinella]|uniref:Uncharacterized protein n=1 Tax=Halteria grandinella TaxID=5974 RepID=A0A8J8T4Z5_HALGN|nr:hypothetical protein FGO68_gene17154 [Halteria grandinella]
MKGMFFERTEGIKKLMTGAAVDARDVEFSMEPNTPVCQDCARYLQGEILRKHLDGMPKGRKSPAKAEDPLPEAAAAVGMRVYNKVKKLKFW